MLDKIEQDIKTAMLAGDKTKAETLRGLKNAIQNEAIAQGSKDQGLSDEQIQKVLARESKKRAEAAELYSRGGSEDRASSELAEKTIIDQYLPEQMDEQVLKQLVAKHIDSLGASGPADMGKVIGAVKAEAGQAADGAVVARLAKELLSK